MTPNYRQRLALAAAGLVAFGCGTSAAPPSPSGGGAADSAQVDATADTQATDTLVADTALADTVAEDTSPVDTAAVDTGPDCALIGTTGQPPSETVGLPTLTAVVNQDNQPVSADILKGNWTVMWFYPAASTFG